MCLHLIFLKDSLFAIWLIGIPFSDISLKMYKIDRAFLQLAIIIGTLTSHVYKRSVHFIFLLPRGIIGGELLGVAIIFLLGETSPEV